MFHLPHIHFWPELSWLGFVIRNKILLLFLKFCQFIAWHFTVISNLFLTLQRKHEINKEHFVFRLYVFSSFQMPSGLWIDWFPFYSDGHCGLTFSWMCYLRNTSREFLDQRSLKLKDELIIFWRSKVKVTVVLYLMNDLVEFLQIWNTLHLAQTWWIDFWGHRSLSVSFSKYYWHYICPLKHHQHQLRLPWLCAPSWLCELKRWSCTGDWPPLLPAAFDLWPHTLLLLWPANKRLLILTSVYKLWLT